MLGPLKVLSVGSIHHYCKLELPASWKVHLVFNMELVEPYRGEDLKKPVIDIKADSHDWSMESIITSGPSDHNPTQHVFLVKSK